MGSTFPEPTFPEPTLPLPDRSAVLVGYLDFFRATVASKVRSLPEHQRRRSAAPSGWSPVDLVAHLWAMERRWTTWGFLGEPLDDPWPDQRDGRWYADPAATTEDLLAALNDGGERTRTIVATHDLADVGAPGPRWEGASPATLERVLLHVLQDYARHAGHLDVVVELGGGATGE